MTTKQDIAHAGIEAGTISGARQSLARCAGYLRENTARWRAEASGAAGRGSVLSRIGRAVAASDARAAVAEVERWCAKLEQIAGALEGQALQLAGEEAEKARRVAELVGSASGAPRKAVRKKTTSSSRSSSKAPRGSRGAR